MDDVCAQGKWKVKDQELNLFIFNDAGRLKKNLHLMDTHNINDTVVSQ